MKKWGIAAAVALALLVAAQGRAVELLTNGNLEQAGGGPLGWTLEEFFTTGTGNVDSAEQIGFADLNGNPGDLGIWLKPWAGGSAPPGSLVNAVLTQTVPAVAGEGYSFAGWARFEANYAGGVPTLDPTSPFGAIPSPTRTELEFSFLNAGGSVIGSPRVLDLRTVQNAFQVWQQHDFNQAFGGGSPLVAPAGTTQIRVRAAMRDGAFNVNPQQSAFFDEFTLFRASDPATNVLVNGGLNQFPPQFPGFDVVQDPVGRTTVFAQSAPWAQNTNTTGSIGAWLRPWAGNATVSDPNDAIFTQTVAGMAGGNYSYKLWSRFETNFSGGVDVLSGSSPSGAVPSPTQTNMTLSFLDAGQNVIGSPIVLDLKADRITQSGNANDGEWRQHTLNGVAPTGTAFVRINAAMIDGVFNTDPQQSAFFDDFSLMLATLLGDFNNDGQFNCADINALTGAIAGGSNPSGFDLTGDGLVNLADRDSWLSIAGNANIGAGRPYRLGDANLDGVVDGSDFGIWNGAKFTSNSAWCSGDFNADGVVDGSDFGIWNGSKFTSSDGVSAVPEPSMLAGLLLGLCYLTRRLTRVR